MICDIILELKLFLHSLQGYVIKYFFVKLQV